MEISRWRKPPVQHTICNEPQRGDGMLVARFPPPLAGAWANVHDANRWLAPPANFQCPSGTIRIISSNNSRDAMIYSRFEVEDFAKQIPSRK